MDKNDKNKRGNYRRAETGGTEPDLSHVGHPEAGNSNRDCSQTEIHQEIELCPGGQKMAGDPEEDATPARQRASEPSLESKGSHSPSSHAKPPSAKIRQGASRWQTNLNTTLLVLILGMFLLDSTRRGILKPQKQDELAFETGVQDHQTAANNDSQQPKKNQKTTKTKKNKTGSPKKKTKKPKKQNPVLATVKQNQEGLQELQTLVKKIDQRTQEQAKINQNNFDLLSKTLQEVIQKIGELSPGGGSQETAIYNSLTQIQTTLLEQAPELTYPTAQWLLGLNVKVERVRDHIDNQKIGGSDTRLGRPELYDVLSQQRLHHR